MEKKRFKWVAGILSILAPGLGQLYCGNINRALIHFILLFIIGNSVFYLFFIDGMKPLNIVLPLLIMLIFYIWIIWDSVVSAGKKGIAELQWYNRWYYYAICVVILSLLGSYTNIFANRYEGFTMPSESMKDTLLPGDYILVDKKPSEYKNDDLVAFVYPIDRVTKYLKRIVALPGDTIEIKDKIVFVNGIERKEPETINISNNYIQPRRQGGADSPDNWGPYVVPANSYFMLGDSRDNSQDSRWFLAVNEELMIGKVKVIYYAEEFGRVGMMPE